MPAAARDHLESLLRHRKLDHTLTPATSDPVADRWLVPTGMAALDARLEGGLPRGHLSELIGPRSSGRLAIAVSALAGATARGEAVALIDPLDMFDPVSAAANRRRFSAHVVGSWRGVELGARQPVVRVRHVAEEPRSRGQGAEHRAAGRRLRPGRARSRRGRAAGDQAAAVYDVAASASCHRRQRHGVRADWQRADRAQRRGSDGAVVGRPERAGDSGARKWRATSMFACLYLPPPANSLPVKAEGRGQRAALVPANARTTSPMPPSCSWRAIFRRGSKRMGTGRSCSTSAGSAVSSASLAPSAKNCAALQPMPVCACTLRLPPRQRRPCSRPCARGVDSGGAG